MSDEENTGSFQNTEWNQEIDYLRNSARGYRGALTRRINTSKRHLKTAGDDPNSYILLLICSDRKTRYRKHFKNWKMHTHSYKKQMQTHSKNVNTEAKQMSSTEKVGTPMQTRQKKTFIPRREINI